MDIREYASNAWDIAKRIWDWVDDRPLNFIIFAGVCFTLPYVWKILFWYLVMPGSFALTYGVWRWWKKHHSGE